MPKKDLVGALQVLLQDKRLQIAAQLPEVPTLVDELLNFQMKPAPMSTDPLAAWREGPKDDLVFAIGLGKFFPFYVTINEVRCSEDIPSKFHLFRVFDFGREPRLYILHGSLRKLCQLDPSRGAPAVYESVPSRSWPTPPGTPKDIGMLAEESWPSPCMPSGFF